MSEREIEAASTSGEPEIISENVEKLSDSCEPERKKRKITTKNDEKNDKLESRLGGILCCAVCLDLPKAAVYQVSTYQLILTYTHVVFT